MFPKFLLIMAMLLSAHMALAEDKKTEEKKEAPTDLSNQNFAYTAFDYLKKTITLSYHGEYYFTRPDVTSTVPDDYMISDMRIMHNPTIIYKPIENWKLLATSEFKYTDALVKGTFPNRHFRSLVQLSRSNLISEKESGFGLSAALTRRIFDRVAAGANYGNSRASVTLSKTWAQKHSSSLMIQYLLNDPARKGPNTWKHGFNLLPTITFQLTDKISWLFNDDFIIYTPWDDSAAQDYMIAHDMNIGYITYAWDDKNSSYFQLKYIHGDTFAQANDSSDTFDYYIGHSYSFTPKLTLTGEIGSNLYTSSDGKSFFSRNVSFPELAFYLDWSL